MRSSRAAIAAVLAGAVALASAAYGIGTQIDDGTAAARGERTERDSGERGDRDFGPPGALFGDVADELGVTTDQLRDAFEDFHRQRADEPRDEFSAALAKALDKPVGDVEAALEAAEPGDDRRRGPCGPHVSLRRLAAELDVTQAELRKALREVRAGADEAFDARIDAFVEFLAERFNLSEDKVRDALPDFGRFGDGPGRFDDGPGRFDDGPGRFGDGPPGGWDGVPG